MERGLAVQAGRPDRIRGPPKGRPAGVEDRGGYPDRSRDCLVGQPARRRRCGKAPTRPPDASFRQNQPRGASVFRRNGNSVCSSGRGPGRSVMPPTRPAAPSRRGETAWFCHPRTTSPEGRGRSGENSAAATPARPPARRRFSSQFRPESLYVAGLGADRIRALKTVRSRRLHRCLHRPSRRAFHRPNI